MMFSQWSLLSALSFLILWSCTADPSEFKWPRRERELIKSTRPLIFSPELDVLFIIDDSMSMNTHQVAFSANAQAFSQTLSQARFLDYHVGVTTSSSGDQYPTGQLRRFGNQAFFKNGDPVNVLSELLIVGTNGDPTEQFISIPFETFSNPMQSVSNAGFYRPRAHLALFIITDAWDQSKIDIYDAYDFLLKLKNNDPKKLHLAVALIDAIQTPGCKREREDTTPERLKSFARLFRERGYFFEMCLGQYGEEMGRVAQSIVESIYTIPLDHLPDMNSLNVTLDKQPFRSWYYNGETNSIHIDATASGLDTQIQNRGELEIHYENFFSIQNDR